MPRKRKSKNAYRAPSKVLGRDGEWSYYLGSDRVGRRDYKKAVAKIQKRKASPRVTIPSLRIGGGLFAAAAGLFLTAADALGIEALADVVGGVLPT